MHFDFCKDLYYKESKNYSTIKTLTLVLVDSMASRCLKDDNLLSTHPTEEAKVYKQ